MVSLDKALLGACFLGGGGGKGTMMISDEAGVSQMVYVVYILWV